MIRVHRLARQAAVSALAAAIGVPGLGAPAVSAAVPHDLFISEYIDGQSADAIEVFNGTGSTINLHVGGGSYVVEIYANGSSAPTASVALTGTLESGDVYVMSSSGIFPNDVFSPAVNFDGNDAVVLRRPFGAEVDIIGQVGVDPGALGWGQGEVTTANHTLRRKPTVTEGRITHDPFDPAVEWDSLSSFIIDGLGNHSVDTGGETGTSGVVDATITVPTSAACLELSTTSVDFGLVALGAVDAPAAPTIGVTNCSGSTGIVYARGTDAAGPSATAWTLVDSSATCADSLGVDAYRLRLAGDGTVQLSDENKSLGSVAPGATSNHTARLDTACPGSTGGGGLMTFQILFLATEG